MVLCSLCEQHYHGVVRCALGWACWKTYVGSAGGGLASAPSDEPPGTGLSEAGHYEDALSVNEALLSMERRLGAPEESMLVTQSNLASTYQYHGRLEEALRLKRDVYSGYLRLFGDEHLETIRTAYNYAVSLLIL